MKKKYTQLILFIVISAAAVIFPVVISSAKDVTKAETLVNKALAEKTYYDYLNAQNSLKVLDYKEKKNEMQSKLEAIAEVVYTEDIRKFNTDLEALKLSSDIRLFNKMLLDINNSSLNQRDKTYLTGVLSMWGQYLIFSPDYVAAMNAVNTAWSNPSAETVNSARELTLEVKSDVNREFLLEELSRIKY